jgi:hypothetical protein
MSFLIGLLPARYKNLIMLAQRLISALDTAEERDRVVTKGIKMLEDGVVTVGEWSQFGGKDGLRIIGKHDTKDE